MEANTQLPTEIRQLPPPSPAANADHEEAPSGSLRRFAIRERSRIYFVNVDEIEAIEAHGNYLLLHTASARHRVRQTLDAVERRLDSRFIRIHRSHIVRFDRVREVLFLPHGDCGLRLTDSRCFRVGRQYRANLRAIIRATQA